MSIPIVAASGTVEETHGRRRLFVHNRKAFDQAIHEQLKEGWEVELEVRRLRASRSRQLDRYYFGRVLAMLSALTDGDISVSDWHDLLKVKFLSRPCLVTAATGEIVEEIVLGRSIRGLTNPEFLDYIEQIRRYAATVLGVVIPDPDPAWRQRQDE